MPLRHCLLPTIFLSVALLPATAVHAQENPPTTPAATPTRASDPVPEVEALLKKGREAAAKYQWEEALKQYQLALNRARTLSDKVGEARTLNNMGRVYLDMDQPTRALQFFQQSLPLFRQMKDESGEARTLNHIGIAYRSFGQPIKALDFVRQVLTIYRQTGNRNEEAWTLNNIGIIYDDIGQPRQALQYYQQALLLFRQIGDRDGEAGALHAIGIAYDDIDQIAKALESVQQALLIRQQNGDKSGEANSLSAIGNIYLDIGQPTKALTFYQQSLLLFQQTKDTNGEAGTVGNIGIVYRSIGQYTKALEYSRKALVLHRQTENKQYEANTLADIGTVCDDIGQPRQALQYYQQALLLFRQIGDRNGEAGTLTDIGTAYSSIGQTDRALRYLQQALQLYRQTGDENGTARALTDTGNVYLRTGKPDRALDYYQQSIRRIEALRAQINNNAESRTAFLQTNLSTYHQAIDLLLKKNTVTSRKEAFLLTQRVKARSLLDRIGDARNNLNAKLSPEERQKEANLRADCDRLNRAMLAERVKNEPGSRKRFEQVKANLTAAEQKLSVYGDSLFAKYPDLAAKRVARTDSLSDIAATLSLDTALIEFVHLSSGKSLDKTVAFVVTRQGRTPRLVAYDTGLSSQTLTGLIHRFHDDCSHPDGEYGPLARRLYDALLGKAAPLLAGKQSVILCPDADLWRVPFAALTDSKGRSLLERENLSIAYSATGWHAAKTIRKAQQTVPGTGTLLALADPDFGEINRLASDFGNAPGVTGQRPIAVPDRAKTLGLIDRAAAMVALPGTRKEAEAIQKDFPNAVLLTGKDAQEDAFKKQAPNFRYLHLATHGFFNDASPLLSSLVLAAPPTTGAGSDEDGLLTARELLTMDLSHCEMAVLSACNTGAGKQQSGEGIVGLTWSLTAAGCPSQVVSGWSVSDTATARLMATFYSGLKQGKSKASALRAAALSLRRDPATNHPYYWAPFFLVGADQ